MAIGTAAAIGLGVAGIGSALAAGSSSKAAGKAADTSLAVAQQNNQLARDIYGKNEGYLGGYVSRGDAAGDAINSLLGIGGTGDGVQQGQVPPLSVYNPFAGFDRNKLLDIGFNNFSIPGFIGGYGGGTFNTDGTQQTPVQNGLSAQERQKNAFDTFRGSTGYQFRVDEGMDALNTGFAGAGVLRSGAAAKEALKYGQNQASNEFGNYIGYLSNQQGVGLGGASALAGVGQNYVNTVSANNNSAGNAAANAYLVKGQNNPFAALAGTAGGFLSSYGR